MIFNEMELEKDQRNKWSEVLDLKYMSSEESAGKNILKVKPLPWLSTRASEFKHNLDEGRQPLINSQSNRQAKGKLLEKHQTVRNLMEVHGYLKKTKTLNIYTSYPECITIASYYLIVFISHAVLSVLI